ncbi:MAG: tetratricopeptide repeat protein [Chitinophagaceae bacterium]|nr:tetratricopeptide repeat protein [Chitinophagaceae bacterium]
MSDTCISHIENHWKALTAAANDFFNKGDFEKALSVYKDALYQAEALNNHQGDCLRVAIPFMQVYIISCNNLSNTYDELGQRKEAENMLKRVVYYLLHLSKQEEVKRDELQNELKKASVALLNFAGENGEEKRQQQLLISLKEQLAENKLININA